MNKKMRIRMVQRFLIAGMLLALPLAAQKVSVQTTIDSTQIWIGQQTRIRFEITQQPGQWVQAPVFSETLVKGIELVEPVQLDTTLSADGHQVINQSYLVTSFTDSLYLIPAYPFVQSGTTDTVWSNPVSLKVIQPFEIDTAANAITDIKDVMEPPFSWKQWLKAVLPWLLMVVFGAAAVYLLSKLLKKKPAVPQVVAESTVPAYEIALSKLAALKEERLWQQNRQKEYYTHLTDIVREYIELTFLIPAPELTSDEMLGHLVALRKENKEAYTRLQQLLQLADLVKFAKWYATPAENESSMCNAIEFVNLTKTEEKKEDDVS